MIVKYSKKFPYAPYLNEDIGFDKSIPDNATEEEMIQAVIDLNRISTAAFNKMNPQLQVISGQSQTDFNTGPEVIQVSKEVGIFGKDIMSCPDLKTLESYKLLVKGKPDLEEIYNTRLKELS